MAYTSPRDWVAAETVTAALLNTHLRDQLKHIAGTTGYTATPGATRGIEPTSGYFMGGPAVNRHVESGIATRTGGGVGITFANAFGSTPNLVVGSATSTVGNWYYTALNTTGATLDASSDGSLPWIAEGAD